jgi:hypothetical protein
MAQTWQTSRLDQVGTLFVFANIQITLISRKLFMILIQTRINVRLKLPVLSSRKIGVEADWLPKFWWDFF